MAVSRRAAVTMCAAAAVLGLGGGAAAASGTPAATQVPQQSPGEIWKRTELFFGTGKPDGSEVTDREFAAFSDREITPAFPDGFTRLDGSGQWRGGSGAIVREHSHVIVLLYPFSDRDAEREIEGIRADYEKQFQQESVLRSDSVEKVSF
ncbi:DUF3574 domain-containing protein [Amycolatopsis sp., V23-08]|uniref:DUF3574 domain-containing protein n=1 Tax=Amycolatopsis heterodermiae TaxID=3110235 RepID=A0ABU5R8Y1_9PSEU|nr:DUF3574 domain-containing protein [Amycolatopsis sp., V23-08]MEA5362124.1 DUF3574 domain-containing protein [Amycolatopsis sp., V23-08]